MANTNMNDGFLDGLDDLKIGETPKYPFLSDALGNYTLKLVSAKQITSQKKGVGTLFKALVEVVNAVGEKALNPGTVATVLFMKDEYGYYLKDIAYFTAAVLAEDPKTVKAATVHGLTSDAQPATGAIFTAQVNPPKKEGSKFNQVFFRAATNGGVVPATTN